MKLTNLLKMFILILFLFIFSPPSYSYDKKIILLTSDKGLTVSENSGRSWSGFNSGLPDRFIPVKMQSDNSGNLYLITRSSGIFKLTADKNKWQDINSPEFLEPSFLSKSGYRKISAFAVNEENGRMFLATKHAVFQSDAAGRWVRLPGFSR